MKVTPAGDSFADLASAIRKISSGGTVKFRHNKLNLGATNPSSIISHLIPICEFTLPKTCFIMYMEHTYTSSYSPISKSEEITEISSFPALNFNYVNLFVCPIIGIGLGIYYYRDESNTAKYGEDYFSFNSNTGKFNIIKELSSDRYSYWSDDRYAAHILDIYYASLE